MPYFPVGQLNPDDYPDTEQTYYIRANFPDKSVLKKRQKKREAMQRYRQENYNNTDKKDA